MSENFEDRYEDSFRSGFSLNLTDIPTTTICGGGSVDTIMSYGANDILGAFNYGSYPSDTITFNSSDQIDLNLDSTSKNGFWKYGEDKTLKKVKDYLSGTYRSHYTSKESKTQTLDLIESIGDAEPFCRSNAIKYLSRFGKKNGKSEQDILKAIHYCILLYHFSGLHNETTQPYETF